MSLILRVLAGRFGGYILIALAAAILGGFGAMGVKLRLTENALATVVRERDQANRDLGTCQAGRAALEASVVAQNAAVADLERRGRAASQEAAEALRRAQERHRNDAAVIARLRRPLTGATACERSDEAAERAREALR